MSDIFRTHQDLKQDRPDDTTIDMYKHAKIAYAYVRHGVENLPPSTMRHISHLKEFIDGYEAGVITHWWAYFKTAREHYEEFQNIDIERFKEKINAIYCKTIYETS